MKSYIFSIGKLHGFARLRNKHKRECKPVLKICDWKTDYTNIFLAVHPQIDSFYPTLMPIRLSIIVSSSGYVSRVFIDSKTFDPACHIIG